MLRRGSAGSNTAADHIALADTAIAALPPEAVTPARQLMRGSPDELVSRIDEEVELFKQRLRSPEARAAFESFLARKR